MNDRQLDIRLDTARQAPDRVTIRSARPVHAARIFSQRSIGEVRELLPRLFSICGAAQASAARKALAAAAGDGQDSIADTDDRRALLMETAREHLWRIVIDWPQFTGHAVDVAAARDMQRLLPRAMSPGSNPRIDGGRSGSSVDALESLLQASVFAMAPDDWLAIDTTDDLAVWAARSETPASRLLAQVLERDWAAAGATTVSFLPELTTAELDGCLSADDADDFIATPEWRGSPCETTPLSRNRDARLVRELTARFGAGLLTRLAALLVDLARVPGELRASAGAPGPAQPGEETADPLPANTGIGQVDAARGRLVHRAIVDGGRVSQYQILAPTEWNFHPHGVLAASLNALDSHDRDTLSAQASLLTTTIDPCVGYDLRVH